MHHGAYTLGINIAPGVFPTLLQVEYAIGHVLPGNSSTPCDAILAYAITFDNMGFIIENNCLRTFGKAEAGIELGHRIFGVGDWL